MSFDRLVAEAKVILPRFAGDSDAMSRIVLSLSEKEKDMKKELSLKDKDKERELLLKDKDKERELLLEDKDKEKELLLKDIAIQMLKAFYLKQVSAISQR